VRRAAWIFAAAVLAAVVPAIASASWTGSGSGAGYSQARALPAGNSPTAVASGRNVTVSWTAASGSVPVSGYAVKRYDANGVAQTVGAGCSGTVTGLSCTEAAVPAGQWRYTVTPLNNNWRGAESTQSAVVTVAAPSLTLSPTSVSSLPASLSGQITGFAAGQSVSFRLDNAATGTVLNGSISPSPVPAGGSATVAVTLPAGTANGSHTIYAIGSSGDTAGAPVTVAAPVSRTITTSAWDGRDASAGAGGVNQSDTSAFADDMRNAPSGAFATAFATSRYVQYTFNQPLAATDAVTAAAFNFNFASTVGGDNTCFYFDVRRASTGAVIGTHGSAAAPVACTTATSFKATSTALPEVTSGEVANDLLVRVYASSSASRPLSVDLATVSGTASGMAFTLYERSFVDAATGTAAAAAPWSLYASDSAFYASTGNWATTFAATRYLKVAFPAYVPSGATVEAVTFNHSYRSATSGANVCYYFEVYAGAALLGTHGSAAAPVSCNSSNTAWKVDSVALPEVNSAAVANALSINLYVSRSSAGKSRHDLAELAITYSK
jgi:hypothetical protein